MHIRKILVVTAALIVLIQLGCSAPDGGGDVSPREGDDLPTAQEPVAMADDVSPTGVAESAPQMPAQADFIPPPTAAGTYKNPNRGHAWAEPTIEGDTVTLLVAVASSEDHVHFFVPASDGEASFIGWLDDDRFLARATVCPCCGIEAIEWGGGSLVCRSCEMVFNLATGIGDEACAYPEGTLPARVSGETIEMSLNELLVAHDRTASGEATLFEPEPEPEEEEDDAGVPACCRR